MLTYKDLQDEVKRRGTRDQGGTTFDTAVKNIINTSLFRIARDAYWKPLRRQDSFDTVSEYSTGTGAASVTNASASVSVTGATLETDLVNIGRYVQLGGSTKLYQIETITSETDFTVNSLYDGTTSAVQSYKVFGQHEYNAPVQCGKVALVWHEEDGFANVLDYVPRSEFLTSGVIIPVGATSTHYTMWGESMAIQQPNQGKTLQVKSSASGDTSFGITVFGTVGGYPDFETITTNSSNGTTVSAGSKVFTFVERVVKAATTTGRITVEDTDINRDIAIIPVGDTTAGLLLKKMQLWPCPDSVHPVQIMHYKDPYRLVADGDVHELGHNFDEAIILLSVAKIKAEAHQKEAVNFFNMYLDEVRSLKKDNADKLDWIPTLRRQRDNPRASRSFLHRNLSYLQVGALYGTSSRR